MRHIYGIDDDKVEVSKEVQEKLKMLRFLDRDSDKEPEDFMEEGHDLICPDQATPRETGVVQVDTDRPPSLDIPTEDYEQVIIFFLNFTIIPGIKKVICVIVEKNLPLFLTKYHFS
jgi:hypothetical protein